MSTSAPMTTHATGTTADNTESTPTPNVSAALSESNAGASGAKRKAIVAVSTVETNGPTLHKKSKPSLRTITLEEFVFEVAAVLSETGKPAKSIAELAAIYRKYAHVPTTPAREWSAAENRAVMAMWKEIGLEGLECVELNQMLPEGATMRDGSPVEEANVLVARQLGQQLGIDMDLLFQQLEAKPMDKFKWSRRANKYDKQGNPTNGKQNKLARHNCCITDAKEKGEPIEHGVVAPHPKNADIGFTFYSYEAFQELKKFRWRVAACLGPFGYKVYSQFHELNKYYDKKRGIGRHGDVERGPEGSPSRGMVNCLKVGYWIPMLFSWYRHSKPAGRAEPLGDFGVDYASFPVVPMQKKKTKAEGGGLKWATSTVAAAFTLGHGDYYQMSAKAIGKDWNSKDWALRHCAGHKKYTGLPQAYYDAVETHFNQGGWDVAYSLTGSDRVENDSETPELQSATRYDGM